MKTSQGRLEAQGGRHDTKLLDPESKCLSGRDSRWYTSRPSPWHCVPVSEDLCVLVCPCGLLSVCPVSVCLSMCLKWVWFHYLTVSYSLVGFISISFNRIVLFCICLLFWWFYFPGPFSASMIYLFLLSRCRFALLQRYLRIWCSFVYLDSFFLGAASCTAYRVSWGTPWTASAH